MEKENTKLWLHLWTQPRKALRHILDTQPDYPVIWLAIARGITLAFALMAMIWLKPLRNPQTLSTGILSFTMLTLFGVAIGLIGFYLNSWLFTTVGKWIKGRGSFQEVKCAVGFSNYPLILYDLSIIAGSLMTYESWKHTGWVFPTLRVIFTLISVIILIWAFVMSLKLIGEAHRFSAWKALLAALIITVIVGLVIALIAILVPLLAPIFT